MQAEINYRMVLVEWIDSYGCSPVWREIGDPELRSHVNSSMGWLVHESDDAIMIVPHISPQDDEIGADEQGCGDMTIPKVAIKRITKLVPKNTA